MVATVIVEEANGGTDGTPGSKNRVDGQGVNAGTDVRYCTADAYNDVSSNPCIIPAAGHKDQSYNSAHTYCYTLL